MGLLGIIGRLLFAIPFVIFGLVHFMKGAAMVGMVPVPGGVFWVYLTGLAMILAGVAILANKMASVAAALLGVLLLIYVVTIHVPNVLSAEGPQLQMSLSSLLKDTALAGGAWIIASIAPRR